MVSARGDVRLAWRAFGGTARGALHVQLDLPNQDAYDMATGDDGECLVLAVADGHGDRRCVRADVGARLAVAAATDCARRAVAQAPPPLTVASASSVTGSLLTAIVDRWRASVHRHIADHPWGAGDLAALAQLADPVMAYGCTLLLAIVTDAVLVLVQIGDGDILVVFDDGSTARPVTQRVALVGGQTLSLAATNAVDGAAVSVDALADTVRLLLLATDGYANSFAATDWEASIGHDYASILRERGVDWMASALPAWAQASADMAGDDVTLLVSARS